MLALIIPYRYQIGADDKDVGSHEDGVSQQTIGKRIALASGIILQTTEFILIGRSSFEMTYVGDHSQKQRQFSRAGQIALPVDNGSFGVKATGNIGTQHVERGAVNFLPIRNGCQCMVIGNEIVAVGVPLLQPQKVGDGSEIVAVVQAACGADTG